MSLAVIRPISVPFLSTSGSFLTLRSHHQMLGDVERQLAFARDQRLDGRHARRHRAFAGVHEAHVAFGQQALQRARGLQ